MATRLGIYNGALRECQDRKLSSLSEDREPRHVLDDIWNDGLVDFVLRMKQWRFARRTVSITADSSIDPSFGYANAFAFPSDLVRTIAVCHDEYLRSPLLEYQVENQYWYADIDPLYVGYISNHADYGGDLTTWPPDFTLYVETHMASLAVGRLTGAKADRNDLLKLADIRLKIAASRDAMESPTQFSPRGSWASSRMGRRSNYDRGYRSRLTG